MIYASRSIVLLALLLSPFSRIAADLNKDLHKAAKNGETAKVQSLLKAGADVNSKDKKGRTALLIAAEKGHPEVVTLLLESKADVNVTDKHGRTALMYAAMTTSIASVRLLIDKGAYVNVMNEKGETALTLTNVIEIARLLVQNGALVRLPNLTGTWLGTWSVSYLPGLTNSGPMTLTLAQNGIDVTGTIVLQGYTQRYTQGELTLYPCESSVSETVTRCCTMVVTICGDVDVVLTWQYWPSADTIVGFNSGGIGMSLRRKY